MLINYSSCDVMGIFSLENLTEVHFVYDVDGIFFTASLFFRN